MHRTFVPDEALTPPVPFAEKGLPFGSMGDWKIPVEPRCRYRLFQHRREPDLHCAVPVGGRVPGFVRSRRWRSVGHLDEDGTVPLGFDREAARTGVRLNGFHLFVAFSRPQRGGILDRRGGRAASFLRESSTS